MKAVALDAVVNAEKVTEHVSSSNKGAAVNLAVGKEPIESSKRGGTSKDASKPDELDKGTNEMKDVQTPQKKGDEEITSGKIISSPISVLLDESVASSNTEVYDEYSVPSDIKDSRYSDAKAARIQILSNRISGGAKKYRRKDSAWGDDEEGKKNAAEDDLWAEKMVELLKKEKKLLQEDKSVEAGIVCLQGISHEVLRKGPRMKSRKRKVAVSPDKTPSLKTSKISVPQGGTLSTA